MGEYVFCSSRQPEFGSQNQTGSSVTPTLGDMNPSFGLCKPYTYMHISTYTELKLII